MRVALRWAAWAALGVALGWSVLTLWVQSEASYQAEETGPAAGARALVVYHPSREAGFGDRVARAAAEALRDEGWRVSLETAGRETKVAEPYALIAVVSNTYNWAPDAPTVAMLQRAKWQGRKVVGLMCGAGSTERAARLLQEALAATGAEVLEVASFWSMRPNDEARMAEPNQQVAEDKARELLRRHGRRVRDN
ncbi:MAG: hypothetical protein NW208_18700 [Bryobacter sp.]|nr:hypothetical protein [Bryobacter sp.]